VVSSLPFTRAVAHVAMTTAAVAALGTFVATARAAGTAPKCRPLGGLRTTDIAVSNNGIQSEVTEYFGAAGYRVSDCSASGALLKSQEVAPVAVPGGKAAMLPVSQFDAQGTPSLAAPAGVFTYITYADPADPVFERQWASSAPASLAAVMPPTDAISPRGTSARVSKAFATAARHGLDRGRHLLQGDSCTNPQYVFTGLQIYTGYYGYYANEAQMPHGDQDRQEITKGHHTWNDTLSRCGFPDVTNIVADYLGTTTATPHSYYDGINVVDFGSIANLGGCGGQVAGVLACTYPQTADGVYFSDIDQRYSTSFSWSDNGAAGSYDVWNVAAHESGHAVGLDHANSSQYLTMYYQIGRGETFKRLLALGDAIGLRCRYGVTAGGC
jgi:hypothetical protein